MEITTAYTFGVLTVIAITLVVVIVIGIVKVLKQQKEIEWINQAMEANNLESHRCISEAYQHIPVVMVSAEYRGWRFAEDAKANYGVHAYVEKPFKVSDVIDAVAGAIEPTSVRSEPTAMGQRASEHLKQGLIHYRAGRIDDAIKQLLAGLNVDPLAQQLPFPLGLVYAKGGRLFDAIQALESSLDIQPRFFPALKNVAVLYQNAGFRNKAIEMWERCLMAAPDDQTRASIREHLVTVF